MGVIYRLVTTWRDEEEKDAPILRATTDFQTEQEVEDHVVSIARAGVARFAIKAEPMENGANLLTAFVPIGRIVGWFVWKLPDDAPPWPIGEFHNA
jgi:hypothetical protein